MRMPAPITGISSAGCIGTPTLAVREIVAVGIDDPHRYAQRDFAALSQSKDFLPNLVVLGKLFQIRRRDEIGFFGSRLVYGFDLRMSGISSPLGHNFLTFLARDPPREYQCGV